MLRMEAAGAVPASVATVGVPVVVAADGLEVLAGFDRVTEGPQAAVVRALMPVPPDGAWLRRQGFTARKGQSCVLRTAAGGPSVVLLGLGTRDGLDAERWRLAAAALVRASAEGPTVALLVPDDPPGGGSEVVGTAVAEGASLASYRFDNYRSTPPGPAVERLVVVGDEGLASGVRRGSVTAAAVAFARDLINTPPSDMTPARLAERAVEAIGHRPRTTIEVWDEHRIEAERLGGVLAVSRGSVEPPRFVRASYAPDGHDGAPHVVLVGKGITFDSGGLSLKTAEGMTTMKTDMSGAAIVLAVVAACAELGVPVRVTALAPMAENMPGGAAVKPGDVFTARNGSTVEVLNTDAEGRLVLADGLSIAAEMAPQAIVDVATLTGAARVALGNGIAPILGNDDALITAVRAAGDRAGERLWPLPMPPDYAEHIDSDVADMKNIGRGGEAGVIAAAALLARFVGDVPWAHLDIAGTGRSAESSGYLTKGGTAFGVRTLLELVGRYRETAGEPPGAGNLRPVTSDNPADADGAAATTGSDDRSNQPAAS